MIRPIRKNQARKSQIRQASPRILSVEMLEVRQLLSGSSLLAHGLTAKYYNDAAKTLGADWGTGNVTRVNSTINFDWGSGGHSGFGHYRRRSFFRPVVGPGRTEVHGDIHLLCDHGNCRRQSMSEDQRDHGD